MTNRARLVTGGAVALALVLAGCGGGTGEGGPGTVPGSLDELEIDTDSAGALVWEIELVRADGTVASVHVDASSGHVLNQS